MKKTALPRWRFTCIDNGRKRQCFTVSAATKTEAINKAFQQARRNARGDISPHWECELIRTF